MVDKNGAAYLAASFATHENIATVAADYVDWIEDQITAETAINSLLAAANVSKDPDRVLAQADDYYAQFENDPPTITSITPNTGAHGSTTATVIVGTNLTGTTAVEFGTGHAGTALTVVDDHTVHVTAPTATGAGAVDVKLTAPGGSVTSTNGFTYS